MRLRKLMVPVVAVTLGVTACGGDDSPSTDETAASGEATDGPSADETGDTEDSGDGSTDDDSAASGGEVDAAELFGAISDAIVAEGSFEFETTTNAGGQEVTVAGAMQVATDVSEANMRIETDMQGASTTVLIVDGQSYMQMSEGMGLPTGMGSWMTIDPEANDAFSEQMMQSFDDIGSATNLVAKLAENPDLLTVTEVGSDTVGDVETTEYRVTVNDVAKFQGVPEGEAQLTEMVFSMWVDGDNLPRRLTTEEAGGGASIDTTYSNYGVDLSVEAPPEGEVVDMSELMNQNQ